MGRVPIFCAVAPASNTLPVLAHMYGPAAFHNGLGGGESAHMYPAYGSAHGPWPRSRARAPLASLADRPTISQKGPPGSGCPNRSVPYLLRRELAERSLNGGVAALAGNCNAWSIGLGRFRDSRPLDSSQPDLGRAQPRCQFWVGRGIVHDARIGFPISHATRSLVLGYNRVEFC